MDAMLGFLGGQFLPGTVAVLLGRISIVLSLLGAVWLGPEIFGKERLRLLDASLAGGVATVGAATVAVAVGTLAGVVSLFGLELLVGVALAVLSIIGVTVPQVSEWYTVVRWAMLVISCAVVVITMWRVGGAVADHVLLPRLVRWVTHEDRPRRWAGWGVTALLLSVAVQFVATF